MVSSKMVLELTKAVVTFLTSRTAMMILSLKGNHCKNCAISNKNYCCLENHVSSHHEECLNNILHVQSLNGFGTD